jgi:hypothetical protein
MQLISSEEAAEILGVDRRRVTQLTNEGLLRSKLVGNANMYDPSEVHQLKQIRESNLSLAEVAARAARAEMTAYRLERQVTKLLNVIGADIPSADIGKEAVVALHLKVEDELSETRTPDISDIMSWAQTFYSLSEEYFLVVAREFETEEPWARYLELSNKLLRKTPYEKLRSDIEFSTAYNYLEMARRAMRQTMFFYVRTTSNKRMAHRLFPESLNDIHEDVLSMVSLLVDT